MLNRWFTHLWLQQGRKYGTYFKNTHLHLGCTPRKHGSLSPSSGQDVQQHGRGKPHASPRSSWRWPGIRWNNMSWCFSFWLKKQCNKKTELTILYLTDVYVNTTHASSSCFILVNSSLVMEPSPSPNFCSFSREASKSGLGGAGGIWQHFHNHFKRSSLLPILFCLLAIRE